MNFEEAMQKLEKITQDLEEGNLSLDESLKRFEEGMRLVNFCEKKLEEVEKRIRILIKEENKLKLEPWQPIEDKKQQEEDVQIKTENGFLFKDKK